MKNKLKILTIVGARPQIIKAAAISRCIRLNFSEELEEILLHTGQHYDENMSQVFFDELDIPAPKINLMAGSKSHARQTADMVDGIEKALLETQADVLLVYGDTNSTLAGALAAAKIQVPIVHIEAGMRSFNKAMPEEINRILTDHVSTLLFSPSKQGIQNLLREGFPEKNTKPATIDKPAIFYCGDIMYDNSLYFSAKQEHVRNTLEKSGLQKDRFVLATVHRNNNTDDAVRLNAIFSSLQKISLQHKIQIYLPLHPRTAKSLEKNLRKELFQDIQNNPLFMIAAPASYLEMTALEKNCHMVITDSGGLQKEAYYFGKHCIVLRPETEWTELIEIGAAVLADADEAKITSAYETFSTSAGFEHRGMYGDGKAAEFICQQIIENFGRKK